MIKTVGKIYIKDSKNGSYQYLRIVSHEGEAYADIERGGAYSEYVIDKNAYMVKAVTDGNGCLSIDELCDMAKKVYGSILCKTPYVTELEFKTAYNGIEMKTSSVRDGAYGAVDIRNIMSEHGVYLCCSKLAKGDVPKLSVLESALLCTNLSLCISDVFQTEFMLFYPCMGAIYCDVDLFLLSPVWRLSLKRALGHMENCYKTIVELKHRYCKSRVYSSPKLRTAFSDTEQREQYCGGDFYHDVISELEYELTVLLRLVREKLGNRFASASVVKDVLMLPYDSDVLKINSRCADSLHTLGERLVSHGFLTDERFVDFLTADEILRSQLGAKHCQNLKNMSAARLGNAHFYKEPPTLFNCFSQAFEL